MTRIIENALLKCTNIFRKSRLNSDKDLSTQMSDLKLQEKRCVKWFEDKGDETLRLDYLLNENSVVFDIGGYTGEFSRDIFCKYNCSIFVFEPVLGFYSTIERKFSNNSKVRTFNYGLGGSDYKANISLEENSSSLFKTSAESVEIEIKSINKFIEKHSITKVDLIKINIEGGEYDLLESILDSNNILKFKNIQVQFHDFVIENAEARMKEIQKKLQLTHEQTYSYEFVWENWRLKK